MGRRGVVLLLAGLLGLTGCDQARMELRVRSASRVDARVAATVSAADRDLALAMLRRVAPGDWRVDEQRLGDAVRLTLRRSLDAAYGEEVRVTRTTIGPLALRHVYSFQGRLRLATLPADHLLARALADTPLSILLRMPGRVVDAQGATTSACYAAWRITLGAALGKETKLQATSRAWRGSLLWGILLVLAVVLWIIWPVLVPPEPLRSQRAAARAERRRLRAERREADAARCAERERLAAERQAQREQAAAERQAKRAQAEAARQAKAEERAARKAARQAPTAPAPAAETVAPEPEPEPTPEPEPEPAESTTPAEEPRDAPVE